MSGHMQTAAPIRTVRWQPAATRQPAAPPAASLDPLEQFGTVISVRRDREIFVQDDPAEYCYKILSGSVRLVKLMEDGRRQVAEFLLPGDLIGFDALGTHDYSAETITDTVVTRYPRRAVEALAERDGAVARQLRDLMAARLRTAHGRMLLLGRKTASERIASFLLEMAERTLPVARNRIDLPMSRLDIADHLGLTIETVCRTLSHLRQQAMIGIHQVNGIEIRDRAALAALACQTRH